MKHPIKQIIIALLLTPLALPGFAGSASAQETLESYRAAARGFGDVRVELRILAQSSRIRENSGVASVVHARETPPNSHEFGYAQRV